MALLSPQPSSRARRRIRDSNSHDRNTRAAVLPARPGAGYVQRSYAFQRQARGALDMLRVQVTHSGELPRFRCVIVANSSTPLDVMLLGAHCPVLPVIDERYLRLPILGPALRAWGAVAASRSQPMTSAVAARHCLRALTAGVHVLSFPEIGPRQGEAVLPFRAGPFELARRADALVVPCAIRSIESARTARAFSVRFGPPLRGLATGAALAREARRSVRDLLRA